MKRMKASGSSPPRAGSRPPGNPWVADAYCGSPLSRRSLSSHVFQRPRYLGRGRGQRPAPPGTRISQLPGSWPTGAGHLDRESEDLSGAGPVDHPAEVGDVVIGWPPFGRADEQGAPVWSAEASARQSTLGQFDVLQDFASLDDPVDGEPGADPDRSFGVEADAVRGDACGEYPVGWTALRQRRCRTR